ncbi:MAG: 16S rRNA (cytidine(1402)-2'-O)-methyltransferase [Burkholderiaceae bacterium]|jgi:16S rRNA (cytidine1402-2'-O)-methyltransferase|nr:16S rRNA (cytidine(1402)-2'-O)-methyltransferase [Burkholderiaceae bacterium]
MNQATESTRQPPHRGAALAAARAVAGCQDYPAGALYVVATPIGNLADITLRALHVLDMADALACEDTRHTSQLLRAYGIEKPAHALIAVHQHNEAGAAQTVIERLQTGQRVAYVSDAGTPAVSDPGARLVAAVQAAHLRALPVPGASSVTALLSVAGAVDPVGGGGFVFAGFLPQQASARNALVQTLRHEPRAALLLEAPHRIVACASALAPLGARAITLGRELTKQFEQIVTLPCADLPAWLQAQTGRQRGEFALLLHPQTAAAPHAASNAQTGRVLRLLLAELPLKQAVKLTAEITGAARNALYQQALQIKPPRE